MREATAGVAALAPTRPLFAAAGRAPDPASGHILCFDASNFRAGREGGEGGGPPPPRSPQERVLSAMLLIAALVLLLLPISLSTIVDTIRYFLSD